MAGARRWALPSAPVRLNSPACPGEAGAWLAVFFQPEEGSPAATRPGKADQTCCDSQGPCTGRSVCREVNETLVRARHPLLTAISPPPPPPPLTPQDQHQQCCQASNYAFKILSGRGDVMSSNCGRVFRETRNYTVIRPVKHATVPSAGSLPAVAQTRD